MTDQGDHTIPVIAIDGPGGTGKGTISSYLTHWLNWHFLDSGVLYRVLAVAVDKHDINTENIDELVKIAGNLEISFGPAAPGQEVNVLLEGKDMSNELRTEQCGITASKIAVKPEIRAALLSRQKEFRKSPGLIADGRDMGTVVFPDAILKIFLTASVQIRAERRYKQLKQKGFDVNLAQLSADIAERDARDSGRKFSPLKPAEDAVIIDTTDIGINTVVEEVASLVKQLIPDTPEFPW